jgi:transposase
VPAIQACIVEPIWDQFAELLPAHEADHPLGCHRPRIPDRVVFDKLVQVLVFGCAYERIADATCSATTLRRRRDAWIGAGIMARLEGTVRDAYDRMIGLELADIAVDGCITKAPCGGEVAGRSPVDRGKQGLKRSTVVDANGIPLGIVAAPANRHDAPLLAPTLETLDRLAPLPDAVTVYLDRGYDSAVTRERLEAVMHFEHKAYWSIFPENRRYR